VGGMDFDTATSGSRRQQDPGNPPLFGTDASPRPHVRDFLWRYRQQAVVCCGVVVVLLGGAVYASRVSENAPRVVYSFALDEAEVDAEQSLLIDINAADAERLQELPGVGPATAEAILEHRRLNGPFQSVEELDDVSGIGPATLAEIEPLATV
jgi:competence protein ComEA